MCTISRRRVLLLPLYLSASLRIPLCIVLSVLTHLLDSDGRVDIEVLPSLLQDLVAAKAETDGILQDASIGGRGVDRDHGLRRRRRRAFNQGS